MKNKIIFFLLLINSFGVISAQEFIKGEYKSYQYENEPRVVTKEEFSFDQDMYLTSFVSKSVLDKKWDKEIKVNCEKKADNFVINISLTNINYEKDQNLKTTHILKKNKNAWDLFYEDKIVGTISYSEDLRKCYFYDYKDKSIETFYEKNNNEYTLFNSQYILKNGIFHEQNLDDCENENYKLFDGNKYEINYSYEGLKSRYDFEKNYYCKNLDQSCLLWLLRNHISSFLLPYLFCKLDRAYHVTSYLTEGKTTYEPENLQQKDGLPWASGNGRGIGEVISIKEFEHKNPDEVVIMNGYQDKNHPDYYGKNSRIKTLKITNTQTKKSKVVTVKDIKEEQRFSLSELGEGSEYDFEIIDIYPGSKYDDLCIQYMVIE